MFVGELSIFVSKGFWRVQNLGSAESISLNLLVCIMFFDM